jgi:hypothetical protein
MDRCSSNLDNDNKLDEELFNLKIFINNFVFRNWRYIDYKVKTEDIIIDLDLEEEEYFNDDEIY